MINYLSGELFKLKKSIAFRVCLIIMFVLGLMNVGICFASSSFMSANVESTVADNLTVTPESAEGMYIAPKAVGFLGTCFADSNFFRIVGIFAGIFVAVEYSNKTIRQTTSKGISRGGVYWGKFLAVMISSFCIFLASFLAMFGVGSLVFGVGVAPDSIPLYILRYMLTILITVFTYSSVAMLISTCTRSLGWSIGAIVLIDIAASIIITLIMVLMENEYDLTAYWIEQAPAYMASYSIKMVQYLKYMASMLAFGLASSIGGYFVFKKQEF